jgi:hypothetical protein
MTPKEKANELVGLMKWEGEDKEEQCYMDFAKQCALIAVNEIMDDKESCGFDCGGYSYSFWLKVEKEIEAL